MNRGIFGFSSDEFYYSDLSILHFNFVNLQKMASHIYTYISHNGQVSTCGHHHIFVLFHIVFIIVKENYNGCRSDFVRENSLSYLRFMSFLISN